MKLDMHCHTHEGSPDSEVPIKEYIELLKEQGFDGMLVTDHDSYDGYRYYVNHKEDMPDDFFVFKGIEYDTFEAGHFIVIMPDDVELEVLEYRGLRLNELIELVHSQGGILGPAHPCGEPFLSIFATPGFLREKKIAEISGKIDFIEVFNCGEEPRDNEKAMSIAKKYNLPMTGGSDAHWHKCVGQAYTRIEGELTCNNDLIAYIKSKKPTSVIGIPYTGTIKARLGKWNKFLVYGFCPYNLAGAFRFWTRRNKAYTMDIVKGKLRDYK